ncbi:hypothetical protein LX36DRAFT_701363 [Colletotrichum falcatum]|nr:hypothetical protein LX36DRAFT_701363 [Colletotrichum falcatum]
MCFCLWVMGFCLCLIRSLCDVSYYNATQRRAHCTMLPYTLERVRLLTKPYESRAAVLPPDTYLPVRNLGMPLWYRPMVVYANLACGEGNNSGYPTIEIHSPEGYYLTLPAFCGSNG